MENQAEFARALGVDPRTVSRYEKGGRYPDEAFVVAFCDLTGVPADFLYRGLITDDMPATLAARIAVYDPALLEEAEQARERAAAARRNRVGGRATA